MTDDTAVTLHLFVRPGTPPGGTNSVVTQLAELFEFGLIGPGSRVWANAETPDSMWLLSDRSTFLRVVDVPVAGWVRLRHESAAWARTYAATTQPSRRVVSLEDSPIALNDRDLMTIAFRNADSTLMKTVFNGGPQEMVDFEATHGQVRAVDLKLGGFMTKLPLKPPSDFACAYATVRGVELMAATAPELHSEIADHLDAFTTIVDIEKFDRIRGAQMRVEQVADGIIEPVIDRVSKLRILDDRREDRVW